MSGYGFAKANKAPQEKLADSPKTIDLSGLDLPPLEVPPEKEKAAIEKGEALGYTSREPATAEQPNALLTGVVRKRKKAPTKSLYIQGPVTVLDRLIAYANETNSSAYWEVIDALLRERGR